MQLPEQRELMLEVLADGAWHSSEELVGEGIRRPFDRAREIQRTGVTIEMRSDEISHVLEYRLRRGDAERPSEGGRVA